MSSTLKVAKAIAGNSVRRGCLEIVLLGLNATPELLKGPEELVESGRFRAGESEVKTLPRSFSGP